MMRLNILHVGKFYPPYMGGIETHLRTLCIALKRWVNPSVLVANHEPYRRNEVVDGIPVRRLATFYTLKSTPLCHRMVREIR